MMTMWPYAFMGAPSGGEILLILFVILLLFGTKNLPKMARTLGRTLEEFRRAARDVSDEIMRADTDARQDDEPKALSGRVPQKPPPADQAPAPSDEEKGEPRDGPAS